MRLVNLLKQPGGVSEEGHEITIRLRHTVAGVPTVTDLPAIMLPMSEVECMAANRLAAETAADPDAPLPLDHEKVIRVLQACLREPGDLSKRLIEDKRDLQALREGLVGVQYQRLIDEYAALIAQEYPLVPSEDEEKDLDGQARDFSASDQPSPG